MVEKGKIIIRSAHSDRLCLAGQLTLIHPISNPLSIMAHSIFLIVTGGALIPKTQAPSQGAGQTRPVNSGKLLVCNRVFRASFQLSWNTKSLNFGIMFPTEFESSLDVLVF